MRPASFNEDRFPEAIAAMGRILLICMLLAVPCEGQTSGCRSPQSPDFARILTFGGKPGSGVPDVWMGSPGGTIFADAQAVHNGRWSVRIQRNGSSPDKFSSLTNCVQMDFDGRTIEMHGFLRTENAEGWRPCGCGKTATRDGWLSPPRKISTCMERPRGRNTPSKCRSSVMGNSFSSVLPSVEQERYGHWASSCRWTASPSGKRPKPGASSRPSTATTSSTRAPASSSGSSAGRRSRTWRRWGKSAAFSNTAIRGPPPPVAMGLRAVSHPACYSCRA